MLPGFRFLFAAIVLSMSILIFGLGAAALLRAAHEEFASTPSWRATPEPKFAQQNDAPKETASETPEAVLAMLRLEPEPVQPKPPSESFPVATVPAEPATVAPVPDQLGKIAALTQQDIPPPESAESDIPVPDIAVQRELPASIPAPAEESRIATAPQMSPPPPEAVTPAPEPAPEQATTADADVAATKIATLGGPPVAIEAAPSAKAASTNPDRGAIKKRLQARRAKERQRLARRARAAAAQQRAADPFAQPTTAARSR